MSPLGSLRGVAAITGIGEMKPVRYTEGRTTLEMIAEVARMAAADAGVELREIDGLLVDPFNDTPLVIPSTVAEYLGLQVTFGELVDLGGATGAAMVWRAAAAIAAGQCETCLCVSATPREARQTIGWSGAQARPYVSPDAEFEFPYGAIGANYAFALIAQRYAYEYGLTDQQRAKVAVDQRTNACANPDAIFFGAPITIEDVLASPMVLEPLHMLEIVMPCAGGAALIVTSAEKARRGKRPSAYLLGAGERLTHKSIAAAPSLTSTAVKAAADKAFAMAGVRRSDIKLASVYDCYTISVLVTLEDAGFCSKGEAGAFVEAHDLTWKGDFPVNTHGGQLSFGQAGLAGGMSHVTEAARQVMGIAGDRQIDGCDLAYVNGNGGFMAEQASLVLGRDV
ncbi:MAG: thiolase family protein [Dehalococcoidia bacterium]